MQGDSDAATNRTLLQDSAYRDDRNLRARQSIWEFATSPVDLWWRLAPVSWGGDELVLDVGCGNGLDARQLAGRSACRRVVASDLSFGMLHSVRSWSAAAATPVDLVQSDIAALPHRDGCADVVLAMHMLYHVPDIAAALAEVRRVLAVGGVFLASTNSRRSMAQTTKLLDAAVSAVLGHEVRALPELAFTVESGREHLERHFSRVEVRRYATTLSIPVADPVVAAGATSVRDPVIATVGDLDCDAVEAEYRRRVEEVIAARGAFEVDMEAGVFVCRH